MSALSTVEGIIRSHMDETEKEEEKTMEKNCKSCIDNEDGFCDRKGILVEEDDACESWNGNETWKEHFLRTFLAGH